jgi:hypothetical protein
MKEAGYADGFEATMIAPNNRYVNDEKIAEAFVAMLGTRVRAAPSRPGGMRRPSGRLAPRSGLSWAPQH